jgi:CRP/FNR family transcriptional regulator
MLTLTANSEPVTQETSFSLLSPKPTGAKSIPAFDCSLGQTLDCREDLFLDGDDATHVYEVMEGIVCAYRILPDGERHIISFYYPGDVLGYCSSDTHAFSAQALTAASVRRMPVASLERQMTQRPELARKLLRMVAVELTAMRDHLVCLGSKSAEAKTASFLLALSRRNAAVGDDPTLINLPMTRLDIAEYLGLTLETVSRMLSRFKRQGLIDLPRATLIRLRDVRSLAGLVDGQRQVDPGPTSVSVASGPTLE